MIGIHSLVLSRCGQCVFLLLLFFVCDPASVSCVAMRCVGHALSQLFSLRSACEICAHGLAWVCMQHVLSFLLGCPSLHECVIGKFVLQHVFKGVVYVLPLAFYIAVDFLCTVVACPDGLCTAACL